MLAWERRHFFLIGWFKILMATEGRELFTLVVRKRSLAEDGGKSCDGKGEDARLRAPGADWNLIVSLRDVALQDFKSKIQAVFEVLSKRFGETRCVNVCA